MKIKFREALILALLVVMVFAILILCWQIIQIQKDLAEIYQIQLENNMMMEFFKMLVGSTDV
jgi:hypothetical protein